MTKSCILYPLIPKPIVLENDYVSGAIYVDGNLEYNYLIFRFCYSKSEMVAPLKITIRNRDDYFSYVLVVRDYNNPVMQTKLITADFCLCEGFSIESMEPLILLA